MDDFRFFSADQQESMMDVRWSMVETPIEFSSPNRYTPVSAVSLKPKPTINHRTSTILAFYLTIPPIAADTTPSIPR